MTVKSKEMFNNGIYSTVNHNLNIFSVCCVNEVVTQHFGALVVAS